MRILTAIMAEADSTLAHAINTFKMADGFARLGHEVFLVCLEPADVSLGVGDLKAKLGMSENVMLLLAQSALPSLFRHMRFSSAVVRVARRIRPEFGYFRDRQLPGVIARQDILVAAETHSGPPFSSRSLGKLLVTAANTPRFRTLVTISSILKDAYVAQGVPQAKVIVLPTGVDVALFRRPDARGRIRRERPRVVYSGHLYDYKGIPTLLSAASLLPSCDFILVGGLPGDIAVQRERIRVAGLLNVTLAGHKPYAELPKHLWDADVLLLPPSANHPSAQWTSPVKLGEYLASGTPVVASHIPAIGKLVSPQEVCFFRPDDPFDLASAISRVLNDPAYAGGLAMCGVVRADKLGYPKRAEAILGHALG